MNNFTKVICLPLLLNISLGFSSEIFLNDEEFQKLYCQPSSTFKQDEKKNIELSLGKKFGDIRSCALVNKGIRILTHTKGFALFFPKKTWKEFDVQVNDSLTMVEGKECWIINSDYTFIKVDINADEVDEEEMKKYISSDAIIQLNKTKDFALRNFVNNLGAYPDSHYFSIGSYLDNPNMHRPFRFRLGGGFRIEF